MSFEPNYNYSVIEAAKNVGDPINIYVDDEEQVVGEYIPMQTIGVKPEQD